MKLALALVVVISTWGMLMFAATSSEITKPKTPPFPTPITMPTFHLTGSNGASYSEFIGTLRKELKDPKRGPYCDEPGPPVPMIRLFPRLQYMYVELSYTKEKSITLAIRMSDIYVDGYSYTYHNKTGGEQELRARFLKVDGAAIQQQVKNNLFPGAKNTNENKDIGAAGSYHTLEGRAQLRTRMDPLVALGREKLQIYINEISYKDSNNKSIEFIKTEARLLLIVIQMVSEAIRFKYIENKIKVNFDTPTGFTPGGRTTALENNWGKITSDIVNKQNCTYSKYMGLLLYVPPSPPPRPMMQLPVDNVTVWAQ